MLVKSNLFDISEDSIQQMKQKCLVVYSMRLRLMSLKFKRKTVRFIKDRIVSIKMDESGTTYILTKCEHGQRMLITLNPNTNDTSATLECLECLNIIHPYFQPTYSALTTKHEEIDDVLTDMNNYIDVPVTDKLIREIYNIEKTLKIM